MNLITFSTLLLSFTTEYCFSSTLELGENFSELRKGGGYWLIKFYAPWCGYCRQLSPLWDEIGEALSKTNINVGRIDCSQNSKIVKEFGIHGFPTIKFITSDNDYTFHGERNKDEIIQFATRISGPPVQIISSAKYLSYVKSLNEICFVYVGDLKGDLWDIFYNISRKLQPYANFYAINEILTKEVETITTVPTVFVYKENRALFFLGDPTKFKDVTILNSSLSKWMNEERFKTFQKVTYGNLPELIQLNKYILLLVVDEKNINENMSRVISKVEDLARQKKVKYKNFVFGWIGTPELGNSITSMNLQLPYLFVLNSTNYEYHIPDADCMEMTSDDMEMFIDEVNNQLLPSYGGYGIAACLYRAYFDTKTSAIELWREKPLLSSIMLAAPLLYIIFICYSLCFALVDTEEGEEEEEFDGEDEEYEEEVENAHLKND
ncbi:protein disulfide-isomerase TMX3-like [Diorhabda carinulata]|uniref:protein disulfide-isomerase TMX3-like n=1 Tax=Diorhabda carinulata TaxID=1163345 RepID=UPI0025A0D6B2|nr:protein disulfide-isomerase TMX3-like [Diorhabda carinulata]